MKELDQCGWSDWLTPGQPTGTPGVCAACGLRKDYGGVKRCMKHGRSSRPASPQAEPLRYDWFAELPCDHRGDVSQTLGCGCGGESMVTLRTCQHFGGECTASDSQRAQLLKNHRAIHDACRSCESCPILAMVTPKAEGEAPDVQAQISSIHSSSEVGEA